VAHSLLKLGTDVMGMSWRELESKADKVPIVGLKCYLLQPAAMDATRQ